MTATVRSFHEIHSVASESNGLKLITADNIRDPLLCNSSFRRV